MPRVLAFEEILAA